MKPLTARQYEILTPPTKPADVDIADELAARGLIVFHYMGDIKFFNLTALGELAVRVYPELFRRTQLKTFLPVEIDDSKIRNVVIEYIDHFNTHGKFPKDCEHYLFEAVLEAYCGEDVWKKVNGR
jgi:hypothetical protein